MYGVGSSIIYSKNLNKKYKLKCNWKCRRIKIVQAHGDNKVEEDNYIDSDSSALIIETFDTSTQQVKCI